MQPSPPSDDARRSGSGTAVGHSPAFNLLSTLEFILSIAAVAAALWIVTTTVHIVRAGWVAIPTADDWDRWVSYVVRSSTAQWLFAQHYGHRLAAPKLLFLADELAFHARGWFLLVCSFIFQAVTTVLLWRLAGCSYPQTRGERVVQAAVLTGWMFSAQQWINFVMPFQVQFIMVYTAAAAMLFALWRSAERGWQASWMIASLLLGAIAAYSMANGVLIFPVALVAGIWMRMPRRWTAALVACAVVIAGAYFYGWQGSPPAQMPFLDRLQRAMLFGLTQLGAPASKLPYIVASEKLRLALSVIPSIMLVGGLITALNLLWKLRGRYRQAFGMLVFYGLFLACTAASIAYGRSNGPPSEAYESRYFTPAYLFWGCLLLIAWPLLRRISLAGLYAVLCVMTVAGVALNQRAVLETVEWWADLIRLGETAIVDQVADPVPWSQLYYKPEPAGIERIDQTAIEYLRTHRLSLFTEEWTRWPGTPLNQRFSIDPAPGACEGIFAQVASIQTSWRPGWRVAGWAWDKKAGHAPRYVILADRQGIVAGVALTGFIPPPELAIYSPRYKTATWRGYVSGNVREIAAYALESDGRSLCAIDSQTLPGGIETQSAGLGVILPRLAPHISSAWVPDGYFQGKDSPGAPPSPGPVYGSFPGSNTGSIRLGTFQLGWNAGIAIPLVTGPDPHDLSIVVRDAGSQEVFAKLDPVPLATSWCLWHPDLPSGRELNLEIVAEDKGSGSGQWLAIGWPHLYHRLQ
jgi:hypothetical protein